MDHWIRRFRNSETTEGHENVLIPGDPEREMTKRRTKEGIPLPEKVVEDLEELAEKYGVRL
jgi:LDH2 family malate/lactate/ureidoglycolate dehydrogenase